VKGSNLSPGISSFSGLLLMYKLELVPMSDRLLVPVVGAMHNRANLAKNKNEKKKKTRGCIGGFRNCLGMQLYLGLRFALSIR
jgi:hypothetical protein